MTARNMTEFAKALTLEALYMLYKAGHGRESRKRWYAKGRMAVTD